MQVCAAPRVRGCRATCHAATAKVRKHSHTHWPAQEAESSHVLLSHALQGSNYRVRTLCSVVCVCTLSLFLISLSHIHTHSQERDAKSTAAASQSLSGLSTPRLSTPRLSTPRRHRATPDFSRVTSRIDSGSVKKPSSARGTPLGSPRASAFTFGVVDRESQVGAGSSGSGSGRDSEQLRRALEDLQSKYARKCKQSDALRSTNERLKAELARRGALLQSKWENSMDLTGLTEGEGGPRSPDRAAASMLQSAKRSMQSYLERGAGGNSPVQGSRQLVSELYSEINVLQMAEAKIRQLEAELSVHESPEGKATHTTTTSPPPAATAGDASRQIIVHLEEQIAKHARENATLKEEVRMYSETLSHTLEECEADGKGADGHRLLRFSGARERLLKQGRVVLHMRSVLCGVVCKWCVLAASMYLCEHHTPYVHYRTGRAGALRRRRGAGRPGRARRAPAVCGPQRGPAVAPGRLPADREHPERGVQEVRAQDAGHPRAHAGHSGAQRRAAVLARVCGGGV
jgi:hypothetical protein